MNKIPVPGLGQRLFAKLTLLVSFCFFVTLPSAAQTTTAAAATPGTTGIEPAATALLARHGALGNRLARNVFNRPLVIESQENADMIYGNAYAVLDAPFDTVSKAFKNPRHWCEVMILHINTKYCKASTDTAPSALQVHIGKKTPQELKDAFALEFDLRLTSSSSSFLAVQLNADKGPLGTSNYRIALQAVPLADGKTFMHLRYSYAYGLAGRLAMQGYLATLGSGKVGFTQLDPGADKTEADYVGGMRGAVERNTMRYYLAIEAYLISLGKPPAQQFNARLEHWFDATEQYPRQLHEVDRSSYLVMKKSEYQRQQNAAPG
ncbi:MAG: hypothetical protein V4772_21775 [Pseudomonadota bacterium]